MSIPQNARKKAIPGYVYIIKSDSGHYKIGKSVHPNKRVGEFTLQLPFKVEIVHLIPCGDYTEAERFLHRLFSSYHVNGEWFLLPDEAIIFLKEWHDFSEEDSTHFSRIDDELCEVDLSKILENRRAEMAGGLPNE